ncbi:shieldin complex subunit 1 isoform X3 [Meriones unguiculatus]|nr:shieldin complex subunit 1 isoform X3 [Meriones unguiculatus]XP_060227919.1 shieldin complex subunit 1 isoform X3 [Meriones unguiculatus]XP_060227921.1 shieldin complex subunit 1 isoform X3 [Meriones unguiculatus]XP_060227922.1 shieldin complex subunit 1 isoform X3 [Meriones unguiculatus]XP_060227923.1 shieldin complex subunit 1 isoform X3 [Meriones unguiculatus]XP_060227924.1 shieldin complex subunit 1 isoform X3 [Meriones unguiculatus]
MESQESTPGSQSGESCSLDLPTARDIRGCEAPQRAIPGASSQWPRSLESCSFPCSSTADSEFLTLLIWRNAENNQPNCSRFCSSPFLQSGSNSLSAEQKDSWDSETWHDPSVKGQLETCEEDDGLRKSLDRFYEAFARPLTGAEDQLSAPVCQCLSQTISELQGQESKKYSLRSFQMARVIFNRDGCSVLQRHSRETRFYPLERGGSSVDDEEPIPGLSREIIHFLLETALKDC